MLPSDLRTSEARASGIPRLQRIHLDPVGGIAGDMFVAALVDAFPHLMPGLLQQLGELPLPSGLAIRVVDHADGVLSGKRFVVGDGSANPHTPPPRLRTATGGGHAHASWRRIRSLLSDSALAAPVREHALAMFALLAQAEAAVHAIAVDDVVFHEVGAWDSIADFTAAAWLIDALGPATWTWAPPPLGGGRVDTAHGVLPVPAPATTVLLRGFEFIDDGVPGERVTPTGAAILRYLSGLGAAGVAAESPPRVRSAMLAATGTGFGMRRLRGIPNVLRCLAFAEVDSRSGRMRDEQIASLQFEIDDQSSEDLAVALEHIRATPGVLEVYQTPMIAKKGRLATQVLVLARPEATDAVSELCFAQTTTLGLRIAQVQRRALERAQRQVRRDDTLAGEVRVKVATRPSGERTAKAEMDDLARAAGDRAGRERLRRHAEGRALEETVDDGRSASTDD